MRDGPLLYTPAGKPIRLHLVGERGDMTYIDMVDEGVAGYRTAHGEHVSVLFMAAEGDDLDDVLADPIDSEALVYGDGADSDE